MQISNLKKLCKEQLCSVLSGGRGVFLNFTIILEMAWKHFRCLDYMALSVIGRKLLEAKARASRHLYLWSQQAWRCWFQNPQEASFILLRVCVALPVLLRRRTPQELTGPSHWRNLVGLPDVLFRDVGAAWEVSARCVSTVFALKCTFIQNVYVCLCSLLDR